MNKLRMTTSSILLFLILGANCGRQQTQRVARDYGLTAVPEQNFKNGVGMLMVRTSDGYWVAAHEVTEGQFQEVTGYNPANDMKGKPPSTVDRTRLPVRFVSANQAIRFCDKLTAREKANGTLPEGYVYSLPTEVQWRKYVADARIEDAVMATKPAAVWTTPEGKRELARLQAQGHNIMTWERFDHPAVVGSRGSNRLGLYDVRGNVSEWCIDWYRPRTARSVRSRVHRGGDYLSNTPDWWSIDHRAGVAGARSCNIGFRVVLVKAAERQKPTRSSPSGPAP